MTFEIIALNRIHDIMSEGWTINSVQSKEAFKAHIDKRFEAKKFIRVELFDSARTLDQNALSFELYNTIHKAIREGVDDVRNTCKLCYGVPIMRRDSEHFRQLYDRVIKPHDYETKKEIMDWLPVTRIMDRAQFTEYLDTVMLAYADRVDFSYLDKPKR